MNNIDNIEVDNLIAGLQILKDYKPSMSTYSCSRINKTLEVQEEEFSKIKQADRERLHMLGWETNGDFLWMK